MEEELPILFSIDSPYSGQSVGNSLTITGWALSSPRLVRQQVIIDNKTYDLTTGIHREDIHEIYPEYNQPDAGFEFVFNTFNLTDDILLRFLFEDENGRQVTHTLAITRKGAGMAGDMTTGIGLGGIKASNTLTGWFLSKSTKTRVRVYLDDNPIGDATLNIESNKISLANPEYMDSEPGWTFTFDGSNISQGNHVLRIEFVSSGQSSFSLIYNVRKSMLEEKLVIESNSLENAEESDTITVSGYYLSETPSTNLRCKIGELEPFFMEVGISRPDLEDKFPEYEHSAFGFDIAFDASLLSPGTNTLTFSKEAPAITTRAKMAIASKTQELIIASLPVSKKKTSWTDNILEGDVPSKSIFFDELKTNLISVIQDYAGAGIENEQNLISQVNTLFIGEIIPSRNDWEIISSVLNHLATVKELGNGYNYFLSDIEDSLGVSDLEKIKNFLDYIQTLGPDKSSVAISMPQPTMYDTVNVSASSNDNFTSNVTINWSVQPITPAEGTISFSDGTIEDIESYVLRIAAGSFEDVKKFSKTDSKSYKLSLNWHKWFDVLTQPVNLIAEVQSIDKRGNYSEIGSQNQSYPSTVKIPAGPKEYVVEWQINSGKWTQLSVTKNLTASQTLAYNTYGPAQYRVKTRDLNSGLETAWAYSNKVTLNNKAPKPGKPAPSGTGDYNFVNVQWKAVAHADYYEIYNGYSYDEAKKKNQYIKTTGLTARISNLNENTTHRITVRAVNISGFTEGSCQIRTKQRTPKTKTWGLEGVQTYRGGYTFKSYYGYKTSHNKGWRTENEVIQGEWVDYYEYGWKWRTGGGYWSWSDQAWGINTGYYIIDTADIRNTLKNKRIQSVTIELKREGTNHGWGTGHPIHWVSHNVTSTKRSGERPGVFGALKSEVEIDRNGISKITDKNTKTLITRIVDGNAAGFGLYKDYKGQKVRMDKAYMRFTKYLKVSVTYFDQ